MSKLKELKWTVGVTAAATNEESVGTAFVRMNLEFDAVNSRDFGAKNQNVCIEMTAREFFMFLHQTENIKNVLSRTVSTEMHRREEWKAASYPSNLVLWSCAVVP